MGTIRSLSEEMNATTTVTNGGVHATASRRRHPNVGRAVLAIAPVAIGLIGLSAGSASAASTTPGDFSSKIAGNPNLTTLGNCIIETGVIFDSVPYPNYRKAGGVRVNCLTTRQKIEAVVTLQYWNGSTWASIGTPGSTTLTYYRGTGFGVNGIVRSTPFCVGVGNRGLYWRASAAVRTDQGTAVVATSAVRDLAGC
jgi:hypothetical protein